MLVMPCRPQGIRQSVTPLLLGFSLLLLSSATAKAGVFVFWLPVDAQTGTEEEPSSATPQTPALNVVFPGVSTNGWSHLAGPLDDQIDLRTLPAYRSDARLAHLSDLRVEPTNGPDQQLANPAVSDPRRLRAAMDQTVRWVQSIRREDFSRLTTKESRRSAVRGFANRIGSATLEVIRGLSQDVPAWSDDVWAGLDRRREGPAIATAAFEFASSRRHTDTSELARILPEDLENWELEASWSAGPVEPSGQLTGNQVLRGAAGVLHLLSRKLDDLAQRLDVAGRRLEFTVRLAR